jgi:hypothetical protein
MWNSGRPYIKKGLEIVATKACEEVAVRAVKSVFDKVVNTSQNEASTDQDKKKTQSVPKPPTP